MPFPSLLAMSVLSPCTGFALANAVPLSVQSRPPDGRQCLDRKKMGI